MAKTAVSYSADSLDETRSKVRTIIQHSYGPMASKLTKGLLTQMSTCMLSPSPILRNTDQISFMLLLLGLSTNNRSVGTKQA